MPSKTIEAALRLLPHVDFVNAYGLTETSSTIAVLDPEDHRRYAAGDAAGRRRLNSVGRPLPGVRIEIRGPGGKAVGPGVSGEVFVRGEQVSGEYLDGARLDDGWFATRDAGYLDADGYLFLDGRLDDIIVRGGENLSPGEIEDVLLEHPAVREAAVVGLPDPEWGERVVAVVVPAAGAAQDAAVLQRWVRERLRGSRTPSRVEFVPSLPYTETGKLLRRPVRDQIHVRLAVSWAGRRPGAAGLPCCTGAGCYGRCHTWAASPAVQSQICSWVPEPPKLVSSRHLFDCGL
jgi:acyl-CoA synthetase (AMP-forming)/AMP-acid ligase II